MFGMLLTQSYYLGCLYRMAIPLTVSNATTANKKRPYVLFHIRSLIVKSVKLIQNN